MSFCVDDNPNTFVYAVVGKGSAFDWTVKQFPVEEIEHDTIVLVGVRYSKVHWVQPGDFDITNDRSTLSPGLTGYVEIAFANGTVWLLHDTVPKNVVREFMSLEGSRKWDRDVKLKKYCVYAYMTRCVSGIRYFPNFPAF
jgi:hypothetical protein